MRALILIGGIALGLSGCGKSAQTDSNQSAVENLTAESIVSNDVTAIDAVTGDAANMAADVDMNYGNLEENVAEPVSNASAKAARPAPRSSEPAAEDTTNVAANTASNAQ